MKYQRKNRILVFVFVGVVLMCLGGFSIIFLIMGLVFFVIGVAGEFADSARIKVIKSLVAGGVKIKAKLVEVESIKVNGSKRSNAYRLVLESGENNQNYTFYSDSIPYDPEGVINTDLIDVFVDPNDYKIYYVDLSFLPEKIDANSKNFVENSSNSAERNFLNNTRVVRPLTWVTLQWKLVNLLTFVYLGAKANKSATINGVQYGEYLEPIADLPLFLFLLMAFVSSYLLRKQDENMEINLVNIKNDLVKFYAGLSKHNLIIFVVSFFLDSFVFVFKNSIGFFLLMVVVLMILSVGQEVFNLVRYLGGVY